MHYIDKGISSGSNDTFINDVGQAMAVFLVGGASEQSFGHFLKIPLGNVSLGVGLTMKSQDWWLSSHKRQGCFTTRASPVAA
jgi:hypothetical protein